MGIPISAPAARLARALLMTISALALLVATTWRPAEFDHVAFLGRVCLTSLSRRECAPAVVLVANRRGSFSKRMRKVPRFCCHLRGEADQALAAIR